MKAYEHYVDLASATLPDRLDDGLHRIRSADYCTVVFARAEIARAEAEAASKQARQARNKAAEQDRRKEVRNLQRERDSARERYTKGSNDKNATTEPIDNLRLPEPLELDMAPPVVSDRWMCISVDFTLTSPWYSKDDRPFHVLDNPVRKDRVFGVPFMAATSWKGLLRWACRMEVGLLEHLERHDGQMKGWREPDWIVHLFGNERGEGEEFSRGALQFFPTWFDRIGFEVINPHSREKRAGTQPIVYEVVPTGTKGQLKLLYAPAPGSDAPPDTMVKLVRAIEKLLTVYGFSAKRTAGWGLAEIQACRVSLLAGGQWDGLAFSSHGVTYEPPSEAVAKLLDESGRPIDLLWKNDALISKTQFRKLGDRKPCTTQELEALRAWYSAHGEEHHRRLTGEAGDDGGIVTHAYNSLEQLRLVFEKGGR